jgi:fructosamine-3-kinase
MALQDIGIDSEPRHCSSLSGGCIHDVRRVSFADRDPVVIKSALDHNGSAQLEAEQVGIQTLASVPTTPVMTPEVLGLSHQAGVAMLLLEWIEPGSPDDRGWRDLGRSLAALHDARMESSYGFGVDNFIGATPQINTFKDDWVEFNQVCRLEPQVRWALDAGKIEADEAGLIGRVIDSLGRILPTHPHPSLLHGDLWSGNLLATSDGRIAIIDPACSIGDGWADIAMMQLFGGIPALCFQAYAEARVSDRDLPSDRVAAYQLYHLLNHVNLFGRGYMDQVMQVVQRLSTR